MESPTRNTVNTAKTLVFITEKEVVNSPARHQNREQAMGTGSQGMEKVTIIGDSLLHRLQKWKLNKRAKNAKIRKFTVPGYTASNLYESVNAELTQPGLKPDTVIINCGSNDLANDRFVSPKEVVERIVSLGLKCKSHGVSHSNAITPRRGIEGRRRETNRILEVYCEANGFIYINYDDISWSDLHDDKIHLNREGLFAVEDILISYINNEPITIDCLESESSANIPANDPPTELVQNDGSIAGDLLASSSQG